jgi:hypothetical protein
MNKQAIGQYIVMDRNWWHKCGWLDRLVIRLFRKTINRVCKNVICRGMERGVVGSIAFHELAGICDCVLWPERYKDTEADNAEIRHGEPETHD